MKIIVGLGNPGRQYEHTRHNAGFWALDRLAGEFQFSLFNLENKFSAEIATAAAGRQKIVAVKPQTFMNESGRALAAIVRFYKARPEQLLVIHDDKDIAFGKIRVQTGRSAAGHNGVQSVIDHLGTKNFTRLRIGIASEKIQKKETADFVLDKFSKDEQKKLENDILPEIITAVRGWLK